MDERARVLARRAVVVAFVVVQLVFVVRAYWAPHKEFGYQMFPEASRWRADVVRVTGDGTRVGVEEPWYGYEWNQLVNTRGLWSPWRPPHHADAGVDNQLAFLDAALAWVAAHTPDDPETRRLEATVTIWHNDDPPTTTVLLSPERELP